MHCSLVLRGSNASRRHRIGIKPYLGMITDMHGGQWSLLIRTEHAHLLLSHYLKKIAGPLPIGGFNEKNSTSFECVKYGTHDSVF